MKRDTLPPATTSGPSMASPDRKPGAENEFHESIQPIAFSPPPENKTPSHFHGKKIKYLTLGLVLLLGAAAWFVFAARSVHLVIEPIPERITLRGTLLPVKLADRYLLLPGNYSVSAEKTGYHKLDQKLEITDDSQQSFTLHLQKLPGRLSIDTEPKAGVKIVVNGTEVGQTPLPALELSPGVHMIEAKHDRYFDYRSEIDIEGAQHTQNLEVVLLPAWAQISFDSLPPGAEVSVDEQILGFTPLSTELIQGRYEIRMALSGYKPWQDTLSVSAQQPQTLPKVMLEKADGMLSLLTRPQGASVTVDGRYQGQTPLELTLAPDRDYRLQFSKAGYRSTTRNIRIESEKVQYHEIRLQPKLGTVTLDIEPENAEVYIDGVLYKDPGKELRLSTVPHRLEIKKQGYVAKSLTVTPRDGLAQQITVRLKTFKQQQAELTPQKITSAEGQELRYVKPARFSMGASRREQGRRANEAKYMVELTRAFYIGTMEVSNAQFRRFQPSHSSGLVDSVSLDIDERPVVRVSWEQAARYCNWLSKKESLPPVYQEKNGRLSAIRPLPEGYRLPTEAEWAWVARYAGANSPVKYPWGNSLPPRGRTANLADTNARQILSNILERYDDGFTATAPVGSYKPNSLGLFDLGGNVAEWVNDLYSLGPQDPSKTQSDPLGPTTGRFHVIRGSGWMHANISELRFTYRDYGDEPRPDVGFRIARYADRQP